MNITTGEILFVLFVVLISLFLQYLNLIHTCFIGFRYKTICIAKYEFMVINKSRTARAALSFR